MCKYVTIHCPLTGLNTTVAVTTDKNTVHITKTGSKGRKDRAADGKKRAARIVTAVELSAWVANVQLSIKVLKVDGI